MDEGGSVPESEADIAAVSVSLQGVSKTYDSVVVALGPLDLKVRTGEFPDDQISVYFTVRQYWGTGPEMTFVESFRRQREIGEEAIRKIVVPRVAKPLAQVIASR